MLPCLVYGLNRDADSLATHRYESQYQSTIYAAFYYHFLSGDYYFNTQQLSRSKTHYRQALQVAQRLGMPEKTVQTKIWLGNLDFLDKDWRAR